MSKYKVNDRFVENGAVYNPGDIIELDKERAQSLGDVIKALAGPAKDKAVKQPKKKK